MNRQQKPSSFSQQEANLSPPQLLQLAESHLRLRNFSLCSQYVLESIQPNDPNCASNHQHASQLLAISNILSSPKNYYSILHIDTFSNDTALIKSRFKHLLSLLDPVKGRSSLADEAVNLVIEAYDCLSDPTRKTQFDSKLSGQIEDENIETFWTFCPYCFYMYEFSKVYEGCSLRCQNQICRKVFHGVSLNSLPKMELEKGRFSGFGFFPLGFSSGSGETFESWSPIVGMFPVQNSGENHAGRVDLNDVNGVGNDYGNDNYVYNHGFDDFVKVMDESDESENMENAGNPRMMKRKSVARNAQKLMSRRRDNDGNAVNGYGNYANEDEDEEDVFEDDHAGVVDGNCFENENMAFFEENGEIFVGLGPDGGL
ncbi:unnamed protein product [Amaranthus hypochondriacus]